MTYGKILRLAPLLATLFGGTALADAGLLQLPAELKADRYTDAVTLMKLDKGTRVDVIERTGGWAKIKAGSVSGWVRTSSLSQAAPADRGLPSHPLLDLQGGRAGKENLAATTGIRGFSKPPSPHVHALIMTIGAYRNGITNLTGVKYDSETARQIATRMGVPPENMHVLQDGQLTLEGMRKAFDDLEAAVADGDQVFLYYSGHGGRQKVTESDGAERCAESLVTVNGEGFIDTEMEKRLKRLSEKAQKVIVFLDACHSGGVTTRSVGQSTAPYTPKYWVGKGTAETCTKPTNVVTRGINLNAKSAGSGGNNFVYVAASRDDEISYDQPGRGGVASGAWLNCMAGAAKDLDGSGGISAEEIRACAQARIDSQMGQSQTYLPHHVTITGNSSMVLSYAAKDIPAWEKPVEPPKPVPAVVKPVEPPKPAPSVVKPVEPPKPAPAVVPPVTPPKPVVVPPPNPAPQPVTPVKHSPAAALADIFSNRDDRRLVTLTTNLRKLRIGKDSVNFDLTSREAGYAYVIMVGSDGETFDVLFPNTLDTDNRIRAGETLRLPNAQWQLTAGGPAGKDTILAIVSDAPKDFSKAGAKPSGPFSSIQAVATKDIQIVSNRSGVADSGECNDKAVVTRNLTVQKKCSGAYGAALLILEEVQ